MIAAVVLAGGKSARLGRPKQLLPYRGRTLLKNAIECAVQAGCSPVLVVLGADAEVVQREVDGLDVETAFNKRWREGIGTSIQAGIRALQQSAPDATAALLLACDQPLIKSDVIRKLCKRFDGAAGRIVACHYADCVGIPALFERKHFAELLELPAESGAKVLLDRHNSDLRRVAWPEGVVDIDTPEDYGNLIEKKFEVRVPRPKKNKRSRRRR